MHFVGMLALRLPAPMAYDLLYTLGSVLIAILITGGGLRLHLGARSRLDCCAGTLIGCGIVAMLMSVWRFAGELHISYSPLGFVIPTIIAVLSSTLL